MKGIEDMVFFGEIVLQIKIARRAVERLEATRDTHDKIDVWGSIQSFLAATGNVSKILWPTKKYKARGVRLRQILKVTDDSILLNREFRNHFFEHYDEMVDDWFSKYPQGAYVDLAMNPSLKEELYGNHFGGHENVHRGYNPFNNTLVLRGEILDLNDVFKALELVFENCKPYTFT